MKRLLAIILAATVILSLAACNQGGVEEITGNETAVSSTHQATETETELPSSDISFGDVSSMEDFGEALKENGFELDLVEQDDGAITVDLKKPEPDDKKPSIDTTERPAVPTIENLPTPTPEPQPEKEEVIPQPEPEPAPQPQPEPEPTPNPAPEEEPVPEEPAEKVEPEKPSNKTHSYTVGQQHSALPVTEKYLYNTLNAEQKEWYLAIDKAVRNIEEKAEFTVRMADNKNYLIYYVYMFDNPELFYLCNTVTIWGKGEAGSDLVFSYSDGEEYCSYGHSPNRITPELKASILEKKRVFDNKVESIVSTIPTDAPEVEKERLIYDYILINSFYNLSARWNGICEDNWNSYGILVNGYGVCESYSEAFQTLCHRIGINCTGVIGTAGGGHKWNAVKIENEWYMCDITFDDPIGGDPGDAYHYYFNLTTERIEELNHVIDESDYKVPLCTATKYNYYGYYGEY